MELTPEKRIPIQISDEELLNNCPPVEIPPSDVPFYLADERGARLMISQVVCENFKSYGGRRVLGPFHKNFTCIIGPNGSGKSNVIDALLFVFGFRASKVRSKKLSSLIHNSDELPHIDSSRVSVHFQRIVDTGSGAKDYEVVPGSEFVVSRKAFKDNSNSYYVNDCKVSFKEVTGLLKQHGIDLDHNRFLILQGEVEQISLMKPKGLTDYETGFLEYLEDIIGSNRFKKPLAILSDRIERLKDIRLEKLARVKAVEKEKNDLQMVRNEALTYLRLLNKITRIKNVIYQKNQYRELTDESNLRNQLVDVEKQLEEFTKEVKQLVEELGELKASRDSEDARATRLQEQHRAAKARFADFEAADTRIRDEHAHLKSQGKRTVKALAAERKRLEELQRLPTEAQEHRETLRTQLDELEASKAKQEAIYKETMDILAKETEPLRKKMEAAEAALAPVQRAADDAAAQLTLARQELDLALSAVHREEDRAKSARDGASSAQERLADRERQLSEATQACRDKSGASTADLERARATEGTLEEQAAKLRAALVEAKTSFQADSSRNRVLTALTSAMQASKLKGILGRLGDLGTIPRKYDIAISTSCGALDHIVVETMELAQKAVEYLKKNNLGQASFIGLDKMQRWAQESAKPFNGPAPTAQRLFDLIDTSSYPQVKPCFYFALRNTLVAENLDVATDWAFKHRQRHRVVTLHGQLIETSGAMSGGGGQPLSGRMNTNAQKARQRSSGGQTSNWTESTLAEKERELAACEAELTAARQRREQLEDAFAKMARRRQEAQRTITKCQNEIVRHREEAEVLTREAEEAEIRAANTGPSKKDRERMEAAVTTLESLHHSKAAKAEKMRGLVDDVKKALVDTGSARLAAVRSRVGLVEKKIKETNDQFTKLEVDIKSAQRNESKSSAKVKSYEEEVESLKSKLTDAEAQMLDIEKNAKLCMEEFQGLQKTIQELNQKISNVNVQIECAESRLADKRKHEFGMQRRTEEVRAEVKEAAGRARAWQHKLRTLRLHVFSEEEEEIGEEVGIGEGEPVVAVDPENKAKLPSYTAEQLAEMSVNEVEVQKLEGEASTMAPNMAAIEQYHKKLELYFRRVAELDHVTELRADQLRQEADAKAKRLSEFMAGFNVITTRLKEMYQMLTQGGDAELELIDSLDPFSEGIVFSVRPPKKTWKSIANLSGGEKTLSSLALVFALHHYKPTPLYVMDEIDAALDFKNVSIVGNYVVERTQNAQFVIISLRNNMFELADRLVGIYKTHNITKSVALDCAGLARRLDYAVCQRVNTNNNNTNNRQNSNASKSAGLPTATSGPVRPSLESPSTASSVSTDRMEVIPEDGDEGNSKEEGNNVEEIRQSIKGEEAVNVMPS